MANILAILHPDGTTALDREIRGGVEQPVIEIDLVYNDNGGEGMAEFIIRNISSNNNALKVEIRTTEDPTDNQSGNTLVQQWDFKPIGATKWNDRWRDSITIESIPPGQFVNLRTRVLATADTEPTTHRGGVLVKYLRSSV